MRLISSLPSSPLRFPTGERERRCYSPSTGDGSGEGEGEVGSCYHRHIQLPSRGMCAPYLILYQGRSMLILLLQGSLALIGEHLWRVVGGAIAIAGGIYFAREAITLIRQEVGKRLGAPQLVRETSMSGPVSRYWRACTSCCRRSSSISGMNPSCPTPFSHIPYFSPLQPRSRMSFSMMH